ncbi:MAG: hypothetical protein OXT67_01795 [Zetaproteobacteria bacterium]|nr:hypothetical protein [Zetaproteobacteria bacterium]
MFGRLVLCTAWGWGACSVQPSGSAPVTDVSHKAVMATEDARERGQKKEEVPPDQMADRGRVNVPTRILSGQALPVPKGQVKTTQEVGRSKDSSSSSQPSPPGPTKPVSSSAAGEADVPVGCQGDSQREVGDFVLYDGTSRQVQQAGKFVDLGNLFRADDVWGSGVLGQQPVGDHFVLTYGNAPLYHGFKFTPPGKDKQYRKFTFRGAEVYFYRGPEDPPGPPIAWGLRVVWPGEFEGAGGAASTIWMVTEPHQPQYATELERIKKFTLPDSCTLTRMALPQHYFTQHNQAYRLIVEMLENWNPQRVLHMRRIVLKGFRWLDKP